MSFLSRLLRATVVAFLAVVAGLYVRLPQIVGWLIRSDRDGAPIQRLRIGHAMAGGERDPVAADETMADAMKAVLWSKLFGVTHTGARGGWRDLVSALGAAEREYLSPSYGLGLGPREHAEAEIGEGTRYLSAVTRLALELHLEEAPRFVRMVSPTLKLLGDNPDAMYYIARVDPSRRYRVEGCRDDDEVYFSLSVHAAARKGEAFQRVVADLNDAAIATARTAAGRRCFTVAIGGPEPSDGTNWLRLPAEAATVVTRSYFELDPPAQINAVGRRGLDLRIVEVAGDAAPPPALPADGEVAARLAAAAEFVRAHTVNMPQPDPTTAPPFFSLLPNFIGKPAKWSADAQGMGAVDIAYGAGRFLLRPGERLLIRGRLPPCRFANVVLWNRYLQTFDFERRRVSLNRQQLHAGKDGRFAVVLAATNPFGSAEGEARAKANWLDSEGRATGTLFFRFVLPDEDVEQPTTQLLGPDDDVEAALRK